jgi:preprotein translocase subunit SecB
MAKKASKKGSGDDSGETEAETPAPAAAPEAGAPTAMAININAQYIKDLSFEAPSAPGIFTALQAASPDINVNINVNVERVQENSFEVVLEIRADCKVKEQTAFILELEYAGVFTLTAPDEHIQPILLIECPRLLFPFARNILADVSRDGGFPPLFLGMVDFAGMYQRKLQELQQAGGAGANA